MKQLLPRVLNLKSIHLKKTCFGILIAILLTSSTYLTIFRFLFPGRDYSARSEFIQTIYWLALIAAWLILLAIFWKTITPVIQKPSWKAMQDRWMLILERAGRLKPLTILGWSVIVLVGLALLVVHTRIIFYPYQMEYREGAILVTNQAFLSGINPWKLENNPIYLNVYGFVYNLVLLPFAWLLGNKVWIYRLASFLAIFGQMVLIARVLRKFGIHWMLTAASLEFLWLGQIYYTTPLARPDALGQFLFLAAILIPWQQNFSKKSLIISAACGWLGFFTKPYFILGSGLVAAYLFLFVSKKKGFLYSLGLGISLLVAAIGVRIVFEAYFYNVIFSHWADTNQIFSYMVRQYARFLEDYWILLAICLAGLAKYSLARVPDWKKPVLVLRDIQEPLFNQKPDLFIFVILVNAGLIFLSLGRHNGTIQVYYYQLLTPFLLVITARAMVFLHLHNSLGLALIGINLLTHGFVNLKPDLVQYQTKPWQMLSQYLNQSTNPLNNPNLTLLMLEKGYPVQNSGQFEYYYPYPTDPSILYPPLDRIEKVGEDFLAVREKKLVLHEYDMVFDEYSYHLFYSKTDVLAHYQKIDTINLTMPHVFQKWQIDILVPE